MSHILRCSGYDLVDLDVVRARGCLLHTADGRVLVDLEAGVWAAVLGHNHPRIVDTIIKQQTEISHIGYRATHAVQEVAAAEVLRSLGFDDGHCVFLSSGSEAVEFAVQVSRRLKPSSKLLTLSESFLSSYGSSGAKGSDEWVLFDRTPCERCSRASVCDPSCPHIAALPLDDVGAFVLEPGSSGGLIRFPPPGLIRILARAVQGRGGLIIANEVTTGVGRTGAWFGHQHYDLVPDIVALGKGLGNGYPVSAIALRPQIAGPLLDEGFHYAQSHQNDPLACAVAAEVLRVIRDEHLVARSEELGQSLLSTLQETLSGQEEIREIRGRGLMLAIEFEADARDLNALHRQLLERGFLVGFKPIANLFRLLPPLTLPESVATSFVDALSEILDAT